MSQRSAFRGNSHRSVFPGRRLLIYFAAAAIALLALYIWLTPTGLFAGFDADTLVLNPPKAFPLPPAVLRSVQSRGRVRVGLISGHSGAENDPGAVCPDGLTEESINSRISELVKRNLENDGIRVDLLDEFDPRQDGYIASAIVSIHADACNIPEATGFKVAGIQGSQNPMNEILVDCLIESYSNWTGLAFHANSITYDMTRYHVFDAIAPQTPGAIIETGFMLADRDLLTQRPETVAQGITEGILCFLERSMN